jgi:hypothetical protein
MNKGITKKMKESKILKISTSVILAHVVVQLVETLSYKPESRRFDLLWSNEEFPLT